MYNIEITDAENVLDIFLFKFFIRIAFTLSPALSMLANIVNKILYKKRRIQSNDDT